MAFTIYAHRGASAYHPENTFSSFYAGVEMGADGIETDIQQTADGVLVLFHDDTLERIVGIKERICDFTYDQLLELDFGAHKGQRFRGEKIVTLAEFLRHLGSRGLRLDLEIKQPGIEKAVLDCIRQSRPSGPVGLTSFCLDSVKALRELDPAIELGWLTDRITPENLNLLSSLHIGKICPRVDLVEPEDMQLARSRGFAVRFWGVREHALIDRALALKGDGMTADFPDVALTRLHACSKQ